uniref:PB1-like domain-containing protein n=1 Tax=Tanacetum cinerariifolium TaxID=118510 RepID=A0A699IF80_TANCI|nr:hypothetical protein [Tanacetum cinerariifolium]
MMVPLLFTVNLYHDGVLQVNPLEYVNFNSKVIDDVSFDGMSFKDFFSTIRRLVLISLTSMHYKISNDPLTALKLLETDEDLCSFVKACYENNLKIDLFTQHNGYDILEMIDEELHPKKLVRHVNSDLNVEINHPLDHVAHVVKQFEHEDGGNVNIPRLTTDDPWLNKLVGNCTFIGHTENPNPNLQGRFLLDVEDPDDEQLLVFCGRDVSECMCASLKGKKPKTVDNEECETSEQGSRKGDGRKAVNEILSKAVKERWDKKGI